MSFIDNLRSKTTERPTALKGIFLARYKFASRFTNNKNVLDVGTGLGGGAYYVAKKGAKKVLGIDYSKAAINQAKRNFILPNLDFKLINAIDILSLAEFFDVVIAFEIIEHLPVGQYSAFAKNISKILNPGGTCLISTPNKLVSSPNRTKPYNPYHTKEFTPEEFVQLSSQYFSNTTLMGIRCINKSYLEKKKLFEKTFRHKIVSFLTQHKIAHELLVLIPKYLKQKVASTHSFPLLKASDFRISSKDIYSCEGLLIVSKK